MTIDINKKEQTMNRNHSRCYFGGMGKNRNAL